MRRRVLVKTWAQRGTLHLHRTDELPLWVGAQAALKPRYEVKSWLKHFKLTPEDVQKLTEPKLRIAPDMKTMGA